MKEKKNQGEKQRERKDRIEEKGGFESKQTAILSIATVDFSLNFLYD
jgi:hypothetical protein